MVSGMQADKEACKLIDSHAESALDDWAYILDFLFVSPGCFIHKAEKIACKYHVHSTNFSDFISYAWIHYHNEKIAIIQKYNSTLGTFSGYLLSSEYITFLARSYSQELKKYQHFSYYNEDGTLSSFPELSVSEALPKEYTEQVLLTRAINRLIEYLKKNPQKIETNNVIQMVLNLDYIITTLPPNEQLLQAKKILLERIQQVNPHEDPESVIKKALSQANEIRVQAHEIHAKKAGLSRYDTQKYDEFLSSSQKREGEELISPFSDPEIQKQLFGLSADNAYKQISRYKRFLLSLLPELTQDNRTGFIRPE